MHPEERTWSELYLRYCLRISNSLVRESVSTLTWKRKIGWTCCLRLFALPMLSSCRQTMTGSRGSIFIECPEPSEYMGEIIRLARASNFTVVGLELEERAELVRTNYLPFKSIYGTII